MQPRLLIIGQSYIDFICRTEILPGQGQYINSGLGYAFVPAGSGAFMACAAAKLGSDVVLCTSIGADAYGAQLKKRFEAEKIDTRFCVMHKNAKTGLCVNISEDVGRNRKIFYPGALTLLNKTHIDDAFSCYPDALLISASSGQETISQACSTAKLDGARIFADLSGADTSFDISAIGKAEAIILDDAAVYSLCGLYTNDVSGCLNACIKLNAKINAKFFIINLFSRGSFIYDGTYSKIIEPDEHYTELDTTASHEVFCASLVSNYLTSGDISGACTFANSALAYCVSHKGSISAMPEIK